MADYDLNSDIQDSITGALGGAPSGATASAPSSDAKAPEPAIATQDQLEGLYEKYGKKYGVDPKMLRAIAIQESGERSNAQGPTITWGADKGKHAQGLMQVVPSNFAHYGITDPSSAEQSVDAGAHILKDFLDSNGGDYAKALNAYSGGGGDLYSNSVLNHYQNLGGDPKLVGGGKAGGSGGGGVLSLADEVQKSISDALGPSAMGTIGEPETAEPYFKKEFSQGTWGPLHEWLASTLHGAGIPLMAATSAAWDAAKDIMHGVPVSDALRLYHDVYRPQTEDVYNYDRGYYAQENPGKTMLADLAGGGVADALALASGEGALAAGGKALGEVAPALRALAPVGRFLMGDSAAADTTGGLLLRGASRAALGARQGAEIGLLHGETDAPQLGRNALFGAGAEVAMMPYQMPIQRGISAEVNPQVAGVANKLRDAGVPIRGSQISPEAVKASASGPEQMQAVNEQVNRLMGSSGPVVNNSTYQAAGQAIRSRLNAAAHAYPVDSGATVAGRDMMDRLDDVVRDTEINMDRQGNKNWVLQRDPATGQPLKDPLTKKPIYKQQWEDSSSVGKAQQLRTEILRHLDSSGNMSGTDWQYLTSSKGPIAQAINSKSDPALRQAGKGFRGVLNDQLVASAPPEARPQIEADRELYKNWRNLENVAKNADKAGGMANPKDVARAMPKAYPGAASGFGKQPPAAWKAISDASNWLDSPTAQGAAKGAPGTGPARHLKNLLGIIMKHPLESVGMGAIGSSVLGGPGSSIAADSPVLAMASGGLGALATGGRAAAKAISKTQAYTDYLLGRDTPGAAAVALAAHGPRLAGQVGVNYLFASPKNRAAEAERNEEGKP